MFLSFALIFGLIIYGGAALEATRTVRFDDGSLFYVPSEAVAVLPHAVLTRAVTPFTLLALKNTTDLPSLIKLYLADDVLDHNFLNSKRSLLVSTSQSEHCRTLAIVLQCTQTLDPHSIAKLCQSVQNSNATVLTSGAMVIPCSSGSLDMDVCISLREEDITNANKDRRFRQGHTFSLAMRRIYLQCIKRTSLYMIQVCCHLA